MKRHLETKEHKCSRTKFFKFKEEKSKKSNEFNDDLVKFLIENNIPLDRLNSPEFRKFFEKHLQTKLKSESFYRKKILPQVYEKNLKLILNDLKEKNLAIIFDETTDIRGRYILNILVQELEFDQFREPKLLKTVELEKTNLENIVQEIFFLINQIHGNVVGFFKIKLLQQKRQLMPLKSVVFSKESLNQ